MIYITGDTHGTVDSHKLFASPYIKKGDYLIVCGDFGFIWATNPENSEELNTLRKLQKLPYIILFIDGNHENFDRLFSDEFEDLDMFSSQVKKIQDNIFYLQRGKHYIIDGLNFLTIGGAMSVDKQYRTIGTSWWQQELLNKSEEDAILDLIKQNNDFDYVLTHAAPVSIVNMLYHNSPMPKVNDPTAEFLEYVMSQISFNKWFCGHYHEDKSYWIGEKEIRLLYDDIIKLES